MAEEHLKTQVLESAAPEYGGFWIRLLAYAADAVILFIAIFAISLATAFAGEIGALVGLLVIVLGPFLYFILMQASARQASFGKALVGLKVSGPGGERLSLARSAAREFAKIISSIPLMVGFLLAAFTQRKQALHDMVAATQVTREGPGHVAAAVALVVVGIAAPFVLVMFVGIGAGIMAGMGMLALEPPAPPKPPVQVAKPRPATPAKPAATTPVATTPAAPPVALSAEDEKLFGAGVAGMDAPSMVRVGPALLELSTFFGNGPNVWVKVHVPPVAGMSLGRGRAVVRVKSVQGPDSKDVYDAKSNFEQPFFQAIDLTETKSGVHRLQGIRSVRLVKGTTEAQVHKVEGVLSLALPLEIQTATFQAADAGKSQKLAGVGVTLKKLSGAESVVEVEGPAESLLEVRGYDAKGLVQREGSSHGSSGGKVERNDKFRAPVQRVEVLVSPRQMKRDYPFVLVRGESPAPLAASLAAAKPAAKPAAPAVAVAKVVEKPIPLPVVAKVEPPPPPPPAPKVAPPPPAPVAKVASEPVRIVRGPSTPGPRYSDLMTAVMYKDAAGVEELLAFGKWVDKPDSRGLTPLAVAVLLGDMASAEVLLKAGADPDGVRRVASEVNDPAMRDLLQRYRK
jgi:uncharacterized RDD family membrane protein YckC